MTDPNPDPVAGVGVKDVPKVKKSNCPVDSAATLEITPPPTDTTVFCSTPGLRLEGKKPVAVAAEEELGKTTLPNESVTTSPVLV